MLEARFAQQQQFSVPRQISFTFEQLQQMQQQQQQLGHNGIFILSNNTGGTPFIRSSQDLLEQGDIAKAERTRRLEVSLKETTFMVQEGDISESDEIEVPTNKLADCNRREMQKQIVTAGQGSLARQPEEGSCTGESKENDEQSAFPGGSDTLATVDMMLVDAVSSSLVESSSLLHLPQDTAESSHPNANRAVPGVCAICLCGYEINEKVTWSRERCCQHAFHHDCIVPWLAKKNDAHPKCPCCRQVFCSIDPVTLSDLFRSHHNLADDTVNHMGSSMMTDATTTTTRALTPFEFMMALRTGGSSFLHPSWQPPRVGLVQPQSPNDTSGNDANGVASLEADNDDNSNSASRGPEAATSADVEMGNVSFSSVEADVEDRHNRQTEEN
jgi:hypothetical protein